ncbi:hypothetical protein [Chroococcidiopsis cubana]|uniref:hypothetical protein n=1 Tax=Chroococcidiopsis cubana TaxID=171392 RepID=UPI000F8F0C11|nr:hypothetical protein [Chroococcidiopsis cubana]
MEAPSWLIKPTAVAAALATTPVSPAAMPVKMPDVTELMRVDAPRICSVNPRSTQSDHQLFVHHCVQIQLLGVWQGLGLT